MDLEDVPSGCCLSPTVPDLCCFARMPWHLPDTIVSSCLERCQQCGMIWKEFGAWKCARRECSFQQLDGTPLGHIDSGVRQENTHATFILHSHKWLNYDRTEYCITYDVSLLVFYPATTSKVAQLLSNLIHSFESNLSAKSDKQFQSSQNTMFS